MSSSNVGFVNCSGGQDHTEMAFRTCSMIPLGAVMSLAMFTHTASGETSGDAIWHNKIPAALSEPAVDIDKDPNLLHKYADNAGTKIQYESPRLL